MNGSSKECKDQFCNPWSQAASQGAMRVLEGISISQCSYPSNSREMRTLEAMRNTMENLILNTLHPGRGQSTKK